jgi:Ca2+-binding EF-hand superfamily protein
MKTAFAAIPALLTASLAVAQAAGPGQTLAMFMEIWDLDQDGKVTLDEARERRGETFYTLDTDDDGYLDAEEFVVTVQSQGAGTGEQSRTARAERKAMRLVDSDRDYLVSRAEFVNAGSFWLDSIDRDGNGVVTEADFDPAQ